MQTRRLVLLAAIVVAFSIAFLIFPTHAVGKEGAATLYLYTDAEREISVGLDSNGRYYVVPGTEYYFTLDGIAEYVAGTDILIWAFRVNTSENIEIKQFRVDSYPFDAIFNWTFPEDWLEEPVKIKYGTNLETDWYYAQGEIWVNCIVGTGILHVYNAEGKQEAPQDEHENYLVLRGVKYYFNITGITEYTGRVEVWASYWDPPLRKFTNIWVGGDEVASESSTIGFNWTIPKLPIDTTLRFKYGTKPDWPDPDWRFAAKKIWFFRLPRKLFVVPEVFLGPLGVLVALFSGFKIATFLRRKKVVSVSLCTYA